MAVLPTLRTVIQKAIQRLLTNTCHKKNNTADKAMLLSSLQTMVQK